MTCVNCGAENAASAKFCNQCGNPLDQTAGGAERRQVTVVFSDLAGFTAMSERLDPEDVQSVMGEIFREATQIIEKYSGRVDKLLGDAVMSVFGDPIAHEDDAERAVRATLEIHAAVDELSKRHEERIGTPLGMHSGINTGVVVTSAGGFDTADTGPLGDTINLAARLEGLSARGEILLGPNTAALVQQVFRLEDHGSHDLKGKTGLVPVARVAGFRKERSGPSRRQAGFVGRHEEMGILLGAVERVQDEQGSVIGIRAEAGSGKTRLLDEFRAKVEDRVQWLEGRAYAYGENIPFAALMDLISTAIDVSEEDTQDSIADKLTSTVGPLVGGEARLLDPFVRLYGLPERAEAALDKDSFQDRLLESLRAVIETLAARAPTVLVFQDLHWVDPSTTAVVSRLVESLSVPVVVVVNYRPSFTESIPGLREIELGPLSPRQTRHMIGSILDDESPPEDLVGFVVERTDGNPFFIEEIINSLVETGSLQQTDDGWSMTRAVSELDLPSSVRGVIAARIDRLDADRRRVLREASVVGRQFLYEVIRRVATVTATLDPSLADLEHADLIRERSDPDLEYFFKHALTQDVAYEGLLKKERVELHGRAAAAIEEQFQGRLGEVTETLAYHYAQAGDIDKAVPFLRQAGTKAMDRYALVEAQAHFEKAYDLLGESDQTRDEEMIDLILDWAILFYYQARLLALDELLDRHQEAVDRVDSEERLMWWLVWRGHTDGFKLAQRDNMMHLDRAVEIAERLGDETGLAYAKTWQIWGHFVGGRPGDAVEVFETIKDWAAEHRSEDPYPYFKSYCTAAFAKAFTGRMDGIEEICDEVIEFGRRVGNNRCIAYGYQARAIMHVALGNHAAGVALADEASAIAKDPIYRDTARLSTIASASLSGDLELARESVAYLGGMIEEGINLPAPFFLDIGRVMVRIADGELSEGLSDLDRVIELAGENSRIWEWLFGRAIKATFYSRVATGEIQGDMKTLLRNPRLITLLRGASKRAEAELKSLRADGMAHGFGVIGHLVDVEEAKLLAARGDREQARRLLQRAREFASQSDELESVEHIDALLGAVGIAG